MTSTDQLHREHITLTTRLETRLDELKADVSEMRIVMRDLADALTQLARVEERQAQASAALERAFKTISRIDERVSILEKGDVGQDRTSAIVDRTLWLTAGLAVMFVIKKAGLL